MGIEEYLSNGNGRIEKRKKILRAFHSQKEMFDNMRNLNGLPTFLEMSYSIWCYEKFKHENFLVHPGLKNSRQ